MQEVDPGSALPPSVKWRWPAIHPEGWKYIAISGGLAALFLFFIWDELGFLLVGLTIWVAAFFRDPVRVTPQGADLVVSPADGLVTMIRRVPIPPELAGPGGLADATRVRVSVFMSVFDVHVNRTPVTGTITEQVYISGKFVNADLDKASDENERQHLVIERRDGVRIAMTQIAGLVARRIVSFAKPGDMVVGGQRVGLIRFGSRVDIWLPDGVEPQVTLGQRAVAGETIIGRVGVASPLGISQ
ncbi:phosphatidylserine decarboxylase [Sphingomonas sp. CJ99]